MNRCFAAFLSLTIALSARAGEGVCVSERFGFDPVDATTNLQAALDSGLPKIVVDRQKGPWFVRPLRGRSNQEIVFEDGAEICAVRGDYKPQGACLLSFVRCSNVVVRGRGVLRMWKTDYQKPPYKPSEWRHALSLFSSADIRIEDLTVLSSGGDGLYLGESHGNPRGDGTNRRIVVRNAVFDDHHRQGLSVITADGLLVEDCVFRNTKGTAPQDGIDFEPNAPGQLLRDCVIRNCTFENNAGRGVEIVLYQFDATSAPVDILVENCRSAGNVMGFNYLGARKDVLKPIDDGVIRVVGCTFERERGAAAGVSRKPFSSGFLLFTNCVFDACNADRPDRPDVNVLVSGHETYPADEVRFEDVTIRQPKARPWLSPAQDVVYCGKPTRITGSVKVCGPDGVCRTETMDDAWNRQRHSFVPGQPIETFPPVAFDPSDATVVDAAPGKGVRLSPIPIRGRATYAFYAAKPGPVRLTAHQKVIGKRPPCSEPVRLFRYGGRKPISTCALPVSPTPASWTFDVPEAGFYRLCVSSTGGNAFMIDETDVPLALDVTEKPVPLVYPKGEVFVCAAKGSRFGFVGLGSGIENFSAEVFDPTGKSVFRTDTAFDTLHFASPLRTQEGVWRLKVGKPRIGALEDMTLQVTGIPGFLFLTPGKYWGSRWAVKNHAVGPLKLAAFVDPRIGTVGTGHAFPGPCRPFGLVQPSPDTGNGSWKYCSGYAGEDRIIRRFSQTHLNGTGQAGLGDVGLLPFAGAVTDDPSELAAPFDKRNERAVLGKYEVRLADGTSVEIAAGRRLAHYRLKYPRGTQGKVLLDFPYGLYREAGYLPLLTTSCRVDRVSASRLEGANHSEVFAPRDVFYVVDFDPVPAGIDELPRKPSDKGPRFVARFSSPTVEVRVALSSRSLAGARKNFAAEAATDFDRRVEETVAEWDGFLSRVDLSGRAEGEKTSVCTALYHLFLQPNVLSDVDEKPRYSTFSLWDTFRDAHPLYEKLAPEFVVPFVESLLDHYDRWGYLPRWELWGRETSCMIGSHAVPVIVSAYRHGFRGFDVEKAYAAVRATLTDEERPGAGKLYPRRTEWKIYDRYGYYPFDLVPRESVSRTLECSSDDALAAQFARALGKHEDAAFFERRSWNFTNLFDRTTLCFRGKDSCGNWRTPFDPADVQSTPDYTEGSALQYAWHVLHRPEWLMAAMGGPKAFEERLDSFFAGTLCPGSPRHYNRDITGLIGDYAHGNEPCHHVPGLYRLVNRPDKEGELVRRILKDFYRPAPDGLCGNDDCGQMSAWYLNARR